MQICHCIAISEDYRIGNRYVLSPWLSWLVARSISLSVRLQYQKWDNIKGADERIAVLAPPAILMMNPNAKSVSTAQTNLRAGSRTDASLGLNLYDLFGQDQRLAFEFGLPVQQDLDGPQLGVDYIFTVGWQSIF